MEYQAIETTGAQSASPAFTVSRAALLPVLDLMARYVTERRNTIPILSNVRIDASPTGEIRLMATDLDLQMTATIAADVEQPGATTVCVVTLRDIVKKGAGGSNIAMRLDDGESGRSPFNSTPAVARLIVRSGRIEQRLPVISPDDFPVMSMREITAMFEAPAGFVDDLGLVAPFASKDSVRYCLNGVAIQVNESALHCVATDGETMASLSYPLSDDAGAANVIIPSKAIKALRAMAKMNCCSSPIVEISHNRAAFEIGTVTLATKLIDGEYLEWQGQTPTGELSGLMLPELEPRLASGKVEALQKAVGAPLIWEMGDVEGAPRALVTAPAYPHWQAVLCGTTEPVYPQGYDTDEGVTVEADGITYPIAVKSGRIHLSAETVRALCGPVDPSTHVYIPKMTFWRGLCVAIDGVATDDMPEGYRLNIKPDDKKAKLLRAESIAAFRRGDHDRVAEIAAMFEAVERIVPERELRIKNAIHSGMTQLEAESEVDAYMASQPAPVAVTPIAEPEAVATLSAGYEAGCFIIENASDKAISHHPDFETAKAEHSKLEPIQTYPNAPWPNNWRYMISNAYSDNDCRPDLIAMTARYFADVAAIETATETPQDETATQIADEPEIAPQEQKNDLGDDLDAQPDRVAALIARMDALEAIILDQVRPEVDQVEAPSVGIENVIALPIDPRALAVAKARQEIADDTPIGGKQRSPAHVRAIMAYLKIRKDRAYLRDNERVLYASISAINTRLAREMEWREADAAPLQAEIERLKDNAKEIAQRELNTLDQRNVARSKRRRAVLKARDMQKRLRAAINDADTWQGLWQKEQDAVNAGHRRKLAMKSGYQKGIDKLWKRLSEATDKTRSAETELASLKQKLADPTSPVRESDLLMLRDNAEKWQGKAEAAIAEGERLKQQAVHYGGQIESLAARLARAEAMLRAGPLELTRIAA
jgi:DNA polymerase III sliding clamp (beta) subunit (PCNA family)